MEYISPLCSRTWGLTPDFGQVARAFKVLFPEGVELVMNGRLVGILAYYQRDGCD